MVMIYTDGACEPNPGDGGWAAIIVDAGRETVLSGAESPSTNNRMEMRAAITALETMVPMDGRDVTVVSDSKYLVLGVTRWLPAWKRSGWRKAVKNRDLWEHLDQAAGRHGGRVRWQWQRGHVGHTYNERCDALANAAARGHMPIKPVVVRPSGRLVRKEREAT